MASTASSSSIRPTRRFLSTASSLRKATLAAEAARNPARARRHPGRAPHPPFRQHRAGRRRRGRVKANGAEGVGLFRTEYLFINRDKLPGEEQQYQAYRQVAAALKPLPVVIRTLDLGGDKFLAHMQMPQEMNPFLGWRAIRFCLQERGHLPRATPRHSPRQRRGQRQDDVSHDLRPGRIEAGQRPGRGIQGRIARGGEVPSTKKWKSAR